MIATLINAFKIQDLRKRLYFTLFMLVVVRFGSQIPVPGVDTDVFKDLFANSGGAMNFFDAITGGSFEQMSVFALNITPYITSSIIMQLLTIAFPALEEMQRDGEQGRKKMTQITRYLTIGLSVMESFFMALRYANRRGVSGIVRWLLADFGSFRYTPPLSRPTRSRASPRSIVRWAGHMCR